MRYNEMKRYRAKKISASLTVSDTSRFRVGMLLQINGGEKLEIKSISHTHTLEIGPLVWYRKLWYWFKDLTNTIFA